MRAIGIAVALSGLAAVFSSAPHAFAAAVPSAASGLRAGASAGSPLLWRAHGSHCDLRTSKGMGSHSHQKACHGSSSSAPLDGVPGEGYGKYPPDAYYGQPGGYSGRYDYSRPSGYTGRYEYGGPSGYYGKYYYGAPR